MYTVSWILIGHYVTYKGLLNIFYNYFWEKILRKTLKKKMCTDMRFCDVMDFPPGPPPADIKYWPVANIIITHWNK